MEMEKILIVAILVIGAVWRLPQFAPSSLNWDEVSLGYNAYSLLQTGRDEWGVALPSLFRAFGDYKLPVYVYLTTVWPMFPRATSYIAGTLAILVCYLLARKLFNREVAILTAFLVAVSPWTVFLSRISVEANVGFLMITLGMCCLVYKKHLASAIFLGLSAWTYNSARIFAPLAILFTKNKKIILLGLLILIPVFWQLLNFTGTARYQNLSLLDSGAIAKLNELQTQKSGGRLLYNKVTYWSYMFMSNYISYFSPNFLFIKGGSHYQFSIPGQGLLYLVCLPFFYLGIIILLKSKIIYHKSILFWLLTAPLAGSITRDSPHTLRAITMLPLPMLITAVGFAWVASKIKFKKLFYILFFIFILTSSINYELLTINYKRDYSWAWQEGYDKIVQIIKDNYSQYDHIVVSKKYGEAHEFVAFYWPWDPKSFVSDKAWDYHANWYWVNKLGKIEFVNDWEMNDYKYLPNTLIISSPENKLVGRKLEQIDFLDGKPAFVISEL